MMFAVLHILPLLLLVHTPTAAATDLVEGTIDWIRSNGGYFNEKLEVRDIDPSNPVGNLGVFAKADIEPHERLLEVPHSCYIALWDEAVPVNDEDSDDLEPFYTNICALFQKLKGEWQLGDKSKYAPFIRYLKAQKRGQLPATWSTAGKDVVRAIFPPDIDGVDWIDKNYKGRCISKDDPLEEHILAMVIQRGYDQALIPGWDLFNHRNGHVNTENDSQWASDRLRVRAKRKIHQGEELYASYDMCVDCQFVWWYWGTPEILRDFGFVEDYKRRWVFDEDEIFFEIDQKEDENGSQKIVVEWDTADTEEDEAYGIPDDEEIRILRKELTRLHALKETHLKEQRSVPDREWNTILQFYQASVEGISKAVEAAESLRDNEL